LADPVPVPEALDGAGSELLSLVGPENLEIRGQFHSVAGIVETDRGRKVPFGLRGGYRKLENGAEDGVLAILTWLPGGPDGGEHIRGHMDGAH
jgi:hypothetical protein